MKYQKFKKSQLLSELSKRDEVIRKLRLELKRKNCKNSDKKLLLESESKLKESQKVARLGHYSFDISTGIWTNSDELDSIFEIDKDFVRDVGGWLKIVHPNYVKTMSKHLMVDVIQNQKPFNKEYKIITHKNNNEKWVHGKGNLKVNTKGVPIEMFGTIQDITERKLIEEALYESEAKLRKLFEKSKDAIFVIDLETRNYVDANRTAEELTGYSLKELKKLKLGDITTKETEKMLIKKFRFGKVVDFGDLEYTRKDGSIRIANLITIPINKRLIYGIGQDKTLQKKIEKEIIDARNKAMKSDEMKSEFLAQMSHEIRSPINVIVNFLSLIKEETLEFDNEILKSAFGSIDSSTKRIIRTIDMILNMSDLQLGTYSVKQNEIEIKDLVRRLYREYKNLAEDKNLTFTVSCNLKNDKIRVDDYALEHIIANLIDNAIKYTEKGSIQINLNENKKLYTIEVKDTGIGITEEFLPEIFSAFSQETKGYTRKFDGTGLGLSLVKKYCQLINAVIRVNSKKDVGSTFRLELPKNQCSILHKRKHSHTGQRNTP